MKRVSFLAFVFVLLCLLAVQGFAQTQTPIAVGVPWRFGYQARTCITQDQVTCVGYQPSTPVADVTVTLSITTHGCGTGWHSHECTGTPRPPVELRAGQLHSWTTQTAIDGWAYWEIKGFMWSGDYDVTMTAQPKDGVVFNSES